MLIVLAWKNVWRNKKRSLIIVLAIAFGLWGGLFSGAVMMGMGESSVNTAIDRDLTHIQIHKKNFLRNKEAADYIPNASQVFNDISKLEKIKSASLRTIIYGMAASPASSYGVRIVAVDPDQARRTTMIFTKIVEGQYFGQKYRNQIIIGRKLAKRLNLRIRSKIILNFQDVEGNISYMACRVVGLFKTESSQFDEMNVFLRQDDLFKSLESKGFYHEIAIRLKSSKDLEQTRNLLASKFENLSVQTWKDIAPEIAYLSDMMISFTYLFVAIILFALLFGITNTMLMSVLDRVREIGILIAVGMKKSRVFIMILVETIFLSLSGGLAGIVIGAITIKYFANSGIDLTAIAKSMESFGVSTVLYPFLPTAMYLVLTVMIIFAASIAAIMPALKAIHLRPSEAIRVY